MKAISRILPPGLLFLFWLGVKGQVRSLFRNLESSLFTIFMITYFFVCASYDFFHFGLLLRYLEYGGFCFFVLALLFAALCFSRRSALFNQADLQWIIAGPWSRLHLVSYTIIRRVFTCLIFALGATLLFHGKQFTLTYLKIYSLFLLLSFGPFAAWSCLRALNPGVRNLLEWVTSMLFFASLLAPALALYDLNLGNHSALSEWVMIQLVSSHLFSPFQWMASSFISTDLQGLSPWLVFSSFSVLASIALLFAQMQPWQEDQWKAIEQRELMVKRKKAGVHSGQRVLNVALPQFPHWASVGTLAWMETQIFLRSLAFPFVYFLVGLAMDASAVILHVVYSAKEGPLTAETYWFHSVSMSAVGCWSVISHCKFRLESLKALPLPDWKVVTSQALPLVLYLFFALQFAYAIRLCWLEHFSYLREPVAPLFAISLLRALPFSIACVALVTTAVYFNTWVRTLSRSHSTIRWQVWLFLCRVGGLTLLAGAGLALILFAGRLGEKTVWMQLLYFGEIWILATIAFGLAIWAYKKLDASCVESLE